MWRVRVGTTVVCFALSAVVAAAQAPPAQAGRDGGRGGPAVVSPQIEADRRVTFRIPAANATSVTVGGDINGSLVGIRRSISHSSAQRPGTISAALRLWPVRPGCAHRLRRLH